MATVVQQRPLRGSRISTFYPVKNLPSLASLDSAFQLQEYISLLIRLDVHDVETIVSIPGRTKAAPVEADDVNAEVETEKDPRTSEVVVDESCWIYEQLRRLAQDLTHPLITMLQQECNRASCPEMKAGEWLYLCVAHGEDSAREQCCAIDYILHTVDSATALLNSPRAFPSRISVPQTSRRHFSSLARRLGRIFAHAYFHHREVFEQAEAESSLYARFLALTSKFDLVPVEFLVIPSRVGSFGARGELGRNVDVEPPRLHAAAIDPQEEGNNGDTQPLQATLTPEWEHITRRSPGRSPPGISPEPGRDSPRRFGRNRTDTMVFSETAVVDESSKTNGEHERQSIETGSSPTSSLNEKPSDTSATDDTEILNAQEIPTISDENDDKPEAADSGSQPHANEPSESPAQEVSLTTADPTPPTTDLSAIPDQETSYPPEATPDVPSSQVEEEKSSLSVEHHVEEKKEPKPADVPSDVDTEAQQNEGVETTDVDDFVPVDLALEESDTTPESGQQESADVLSAAVLVVEEVSPPAARSSAELEESEVESTTAVAEMKKDEEKSIETPPIVSENQEEHREDND